MAGGVRQLSRGRKGSQSEPPAPIVPPAYWGWYGDSHTAGREPELTAKNPRTCFRTIWEATLTPPTAVDTHYQTGVSGRRLQATLTYLLGRTHAGTPWIQIQESGDQNNDGQRTASEWGDTFQQGWIDIEAQWPGCFKTYETAHSFSPARKAEPYRNWDAYNVELRSRVQTLAGLGITVRLIETEYYIDLLIAQLGYDAVAFPDAHADAYHFQGIGNFCIALATFKALNYDVTTLDHSGVILDASHKATAVSVVASNPA
jgi:hypothetical protein